MVDGATLSTVADFLMVSRSHSACSAFDRHVRWLIKPWLPAPVEERQPPVLASCGLLESLKVRRRCGFSLCAAQMRRALEGLRPTGLRVRGDRTGGRGHCDSLRRCGGELGLLATTLGSSSTRAFRNAARASVSRIAQKLCIFS